MTPIIHQLRAGPVRRLGRDGAPDPMDRPWETGIFKQPITGDIWLGTSGLDGDAVGDTRNHGGPEKALFAYPLHHYDYWTTRPGLADMTPGGMGENLVIEAAAEDTICIGDTYAFCDAIIQVSQPRQPCWRPARRFRVADLALQIQNTGRTGWYFRVLQEGSVTAGTSLTLLERPAPQWTIARCNQIMHTPPADPNPTAELATLPHLSPNWQRTLKNRLAGQPPSIQRRVYGPNKDPE